jgi:type I restriction enzyme M protein
MFEQSLKNIDNILRADNAGGAMDYIEQTSWILFLKYLDDLEETKKTEAALAGKKYTYILQPEYRWSIWACPKTPDGKADHHKMLDGDDLRDFVNLKLIPYLKKFKVSAESPDTIEYKIGEIFSELKNKIQSGYALRNILDIVDGLHFRTAEEKHEWSHLYESKIRGMGNAGQDGGQYYTPRPLIKTIIKVVDPKIGETIYDGACGSAGFLVEAFDYLIKDREKLSPKDWEILQKKTLYGKEKISLPYIIGIMNMILHGVEAPHILRTNTLAQNLADIQEKDRYNVVLANPPFGGKERSELQQNFPIKTGATEMLFLQHFIKILKAGGRAGIVIKNTFLSNTDNASVSLRKLLLETCNLHTVLDLPGGAFQGAGVKTVVLFFEKGKPTQKVWYYQLNLDRNLGKTNSLNEKDLEDFVKLQKTKADSPNSWSITILPQGQRTTPGASLKEEHSDGERGALGVVSVFNFQTCDLSVKNPNKGDEVVLREPKDILNEIKKLDEESEKVLAGIKKMIQL